MSRLHRASIAAVAAAVLATGLAACGQKKSEPGVTDTEIKLGQTMPYSGPASAYGAIGRTELAYFKMVNEQGGVNGRKINLISLDDAYSPPRAVEQVRKLIEEDQVAALFQTLGTPTNTAIHKYVNGKQVPHLFLATGATKWGDPKNYPWTIGFQPSYQVEAKIYARYILDQNPDAKIGVIYQNDDYGKDYLHGLKEGLADKAASMIVAEASYEVTDPTVDSQIVSLKASGADTLVTIATPKFAAQAIRKVHDIGWRPLHIINNVAASVGAVLTPAGLDKSVGLITAHYFKDPTESRWADDPGMQRWRSFMEKYMPGVDMTDLNYVYGYGAGQLMVRLLEQCGDDLSRENLMRQAANMKKLELDILLPGIVFDTGPDDFFGIERLQLQRFDGKRWALFGEVIGHD